jgi:hypothetical protein
LLFKVGTSGWQPLKYKDMQQLPCALPVRQGANQIVHSTHVEFSQNLSFAARRLAARFGLEPSVAALLADLARIGPREVA